jgi:hypothetical protein
VRTAEDSAIAFERQTIDGHVAAAEADQESASAEVVRGAKRRFGSIDGEIVHAAKYDFAMKGEDAGREWAAGKERQGYEECRKSDHTRNQAAKMTMAPLQ